jgi:hypothetical protein
MGKYGTWEDVPNGAFKEVLRSVVMENPTSLALDCLIRDDEDLAVLLKTLHSVAKHTVTTLSMRYCGLRSESAVAQLVELCGVTWENEKPKGVIFHGPNLCILETMYLSESVTEKAADQIRAAWLTQGWQHKAPGMPVDDDAEGPHSTAPTFRRKLKTYAPTKAERDAFLPPWVVENEEANGGKKKGGKDKGGKKAKKK